MSSEPEVIEFFERLCDAVPELVPLRAEHLKDYGELLGHLLIADVGRWALQALDEDLAGVDRLLAELERSYGEGQEQVNNMIDVSFLEHLIHEPPDSREAQLSRRLPTRLAAEFRQMEDWRPN